MSDLVGNPEDRFSHNEALIWLHVQHVFMHMFAKYYWFRVCYAVFYTVVTLWNKECDMSQHFDTCLLYFGTATALELLSILDQVDIFSTPYLSLVVRKPVFGVSDHADTNLVAQP